MTVNNHYYTIIMYYAIYIISIIKVYYVVKYHCSKWSR